MENGWGSVHVSQVPQGERGSSKPRYQPWFLGMDCQTTDREIVVLLGAIQAAGKGGHDRIARRVQFQGLLVFGGSSFQAGQARLVGVDDLEGCRSRPSMSGSETAVGLCGVPHT